MTIAALIAEFNPLHNGHKYIINQIKQQYNIDYVIAIMSGDFVQRGEPAILPKHLRAKCAILAGCDAVFELPVKYATASASIFAFGGVSIIDALSCVDYIFFGSECGDINLLKQVADILSDEPEDFKNFLKEQLSSGTSYPKAVQTALSQIDVSLGEILSTANNTLGVEYLKALKQLKSKVLPLTLSRVGTEHNSTSTTFVESLGVFTSATNIRTIINNIPTINQSSNATNYDSNTNALIDHPSDNLYFQLTELLPEETQTLVFDFLKSQTPITTDDLSLLLWEKLSKLSITDINEYPESCNDLSNIIYKSKNSFSTISGLVEICCRKQYTKARVSRLLLQIILDIRTKDIKNENYLAPAYIRLLAFKKESSSLLRLLQDSSTIPIITKAADYMNVKTPEIHNDDFRKDLHCSDLYNNVLAVKNHIPFRQDIVVSPEII